MTSTTRATERARRAAERSSSKGKIFIIYIAGKDPTPADLKSNRRTQPQPAPTRRGHARQLDRIC